MDTKGDAALGDGYIASLELFPGLGVVGLQVTHVRNVSRPQSLVLDASSTSELPLSIEQSKYSKTNKAVPKSFSNQRWPNYFGFVGFLAPKNVELGVEFKALSYIEAEIWTNMYFPAAILKNPRWPPCGYLCKWKHWFADCLYHLVFKNV